VLSAHKRETPSMNLEDVTKTLTDRFRLYVGMFFFAPRNEIKPTTIRFHDTAAFAETESAKLIITNSN